MAKKNGGSAECGTVGVAEVGEDLVDLFARLAANSQPAGKSRRKAQQETKGLPDPETLRGMAKAYLELQREHWPELAKRGLPPKPTAKVVEGMAAEFEIRFRDGETATVGPLLSDPPWQELGAAYLRFSDDNSNPRSLVQQLRNVLKRAADDGVFIPFAYIFADAAVTGTIAARRGYAACKALLRRGDAAVQRLYVDEIGRAGRDAIEALSLGRLVEVLGKRMIGVTDGFDSAKPEWKLQLHMYAMMQEWFVDQLRSKVNRGMEDAFLRGDNIFGACFGYKLVWKTDATGNPVLGRDGLPEMTRAIDTEQETWVRQAYELLVIEGWSRAKIAKHFNEQAVGGVRTWDGTKLRQLLRREVYKGIEFYRKTKQRKDATTGGVTVIEIPRTKQLSREVPHLRIVSDELWDKAQAKLATTRASYTSQDKDRPRKSEIHLKTLLRPICGHCKEPLILGRSGPHPSFCCLNGRDGKQGCTLKSYKSVRIVETAVLDHLRQTVMTGEFLDRLVKEANAFLAAELTRPPESTAPLEAELRKKERAIERISARLEQVEDTTKLDVVFTQITRLRGDADQLKARLEAMQPTDLAPPRPVTREDVEALLGDLHALLAKDVAAVAPVLAALTGPIEVVQSPTQRSKRGAAWVGRFTVNAVPVLLELAVRRGCFTTAAWRYLDGRWVPPTDIAAITLGVTPRKNDASIRSGCTKDSSSRGAA